VSLLKDTCLILLKTLKMFKLLTKGISTGKSKLENIEARRKISIETSWINQPASSIQKPAPSNSKVNANIPLMSILWQALW